LHIPQLIIEHNPSGYAKFCLSRLAPDYLFAVAAMLLSDATSPDGIWHVPSIVPDGRINFADCRGGFDPHAACIHGNDAPIPQALSDDGDRHTYAPSHIRIEGIKRRVGRREIFRQAGRTAHRNIELQIILPTNA
jgi:hypothetical protein